MYCQKRDNAFLGKRQWISRTNTMHFQKTYNAFHKRDNIFWILENLIKEYKEDSAENNWNKVPDADKLNILLIRALKS